jgi:hypothetical protein
MEPDGSLLPSQEPATGPYPEPDASSLHPLNGACIYISPPAWHR